MEGTVVRWIVKTGQKVERDEPLVEIAPTRPTPRSPRRHRGARRAARERGGGGHGRRTLATDEAGSASATSAPKPGHALGAHRIRSGAGGARDLLRASGDANGIRSTPVGRNVAQEHGLDLSKVPARARAAG